MASSFLDMAFFGHARPSYAEMHAPKFGPTPVSTKVTNQRTSEELFGGPTQSICLFTTLVRFSHVLLNDIVRSSAVDFAWSQLVISPAMPEARAMAPPAKVQKTDLTQEAKAAPPPPAELAPLEFGPAPGAEAAGFMQHMTSMSLGCASPDKLSSISRFRPL